MKNRLAQTQKILQKMRLTPKMKHSIQMLGMSAKDLNEYIDAVLASNPFLEKKIDKHAAMKHETGQSPFSGNIDERGYKEEIAHSKEKDPKEHLLSQVRTLDLDKKDLEIAEYLIYELDENGYLEINPEDVAQDLFTDRDKAQGVLEMIQGLDPPGIGARDIKECLQIQLERKEKKDSLEYGIVTDFLSDVAVNDIASIAKSLGADRERVRIAVKNIKALNPHPASSLLSKGAERVIPDLIANVTDKKVRIELNRESVPRLRLYNPYENKVDVIKDPEARKFLKENMKAAEHLIDNIKMREETMCRVTDYILNFQKQAFSGDGRGIEPLTIKDIAEALALHPSTICRTVLNKYICIGDKTAPLKSFLSHGIQKENGEFASKASIKSRIRELIDTEDKSKPLSDDAIRKKLQEEGIPIKRRTVAKYRESLRVLPTYLRRKRSAETLPTLPKRALKKSPEF